MSYSTLHLQHLWNGLECNIRMSLQICIYIYHRTQGKLAAPGGFCQMAGLVVVWKCVSTVEQRAIYERGGWHTSPTPPPTAGPIQR